MDCATDDKSGKQRLALLLDIGFSETTPDMWTSSSCDSQAGSSSARLKLHAIISTIRIPRPRSDRRRPDAELAAPRLHESIALPPNGLLGGSRCHAIAAGQKLSRLTHLPLWLKFCGIIPKSPPATPCSRHSARKRTTASSRSCIAAAYRISIPRSIRVVISVRDVTSVMARRVVLRVRVYP